MARNLNPYLSLKEMRMKVIRHAIALALASAVIFAFAVAQFAQAQTQTATGQVNAFYSLPSGDNINGAIAAGVGSAGFTATDPKLAQGGAAATGSGISSQTINPGATAGTSTAKAVTNTTANASGENAALNVSSTATQGNWLGLGSDTFVAGGSFTGATSNGTLSAEAPVQGAAGATTNGQTTGSFTGAGTTNVTENTHVTGMSMGSTTLTTTDPNATQNASVGVWGNGVGEGQGVVGDTSSNRYAVGNFTGGASYEGSNATGALNAGQLQITGAGAEIIQGGKVSVSSTVNSSAQAK